MPPNVCERRTGRHDGRTATAASCTLPTTPRTPARHARIDERQRGRDEVDADPLRQELVEVAAEHERSERDREDHLDDADHRAGRDGRQHAPGPPFLSHRSPPQQHRHAESTLVRRGSVPLAGTTGSALT